MSATLDEKASALPKSGQPKFIQITSGLPYGAALTIFALDEDGHVWQLVPGRDDDAWKPLSRKRGRPASR